MHSFELYVRGSVPRSLSGSLLVAASRRNKDRSAFARWHDSQADLFRIDLTPGRPGKVRVRLLTPDPTGRDVGCPNPTGFYSTQPNHGMNVQDGRAWATNLLFGAPLEIDLQRWKPRRILRYLEPTPDAPQLTGTSHFAWSPDRRYAYFHQSLLERERGRKLVRASRLILVEFDTRTDRERTWEIEPPPDDDSLETANFHSAFCFEEAGRRYVGLLRTGARLEHLAARHDASEHHVHPMPFSTVWVLEIEPSAARLRATTLPGIEHLQGLALSHLDVDASGGNGFVLFANYKQADVAEETHGTNVYGESPGRVYEHYSGMTVEALNYGIVLRYERRDGRHSLRTYSRTFDPNNTSLGHSWLPINLEIDRGRRWVFGSFAGFRPRLLPRHVARAYPQLVADRMRVRYVPPLLLRFCAATLEPDIDKRRRHLSYAEPVAMAVAGEGAETYVCTFSPETGLRVYPAEDLSGMVCHAVAPEFMNWGETHFRPDPAHMQFVAA